MMLSESMDRIIELLRSLVCMRLLSPESEEEISYSAVLSMAVRLLPETRP